MIDKCVASEDEMQAFRSKGRPVLMYHLHGRTFIDSEANAQLMAASRELYEALNYIYTQLAGSDAITQGEAEKMRVALARARGEG